MKTRRALDKPFYSCVTHEDRFEQKVDNCIFPTSQFMTLYTKRPLPMYKFQLWQHINRADRDCRKELREEMLQEIDSDEVSLDPVCFSDEATFRLNCAVNRHTCRI